MPDTTHIDLAARGTVGPQGEGATTKPVSLKLPDGTIARRRNSEPEPLQPVADYLPLAELGRGGMGIVYQAFDPRRGHTVAVKVLTKDLAANRKSRRRFLREAKAAASVAHPQVVTIFDVGEDHGRPYFVMEYLGGGSLQARLRGKTLVPMLPIPTVIRIAEQVASGLSAAHAQGIVHRDIKPGNLLFVDNGDDIKITDFGVFRVIEGDPALFSSASGSTLDAPQTVGTPAYMSPEQVLGEELNYRSDLFSLGAVIHAMVTGRSPFERPTLMELIEAVLQFEPPRLHTLAPDVPPSLSDLVADLLQKQPAARVPSAAETTRRLQQIV